MCWSLVGRVHELHLRRLLGRATRAYLGKHVELWLGGGGESLRGVVVLADQGVRGSEGNSSRHVVVRRLHLHGHVLADFVECVELHLVLRLRSLAQELSWRERGLGWLRLLAEIVLQRL